MGEGWGGGGGVSGWVGAGREQMDAELLPAYCFTVETTPQAALNHLVIKKGHFFQDLKCPVGSNSKLGDFSIFCDCRFSQPA